VLERARSEQPYSILDLPLNLLIGKDGASLSQNKHSLCLQFWILLFHLLHQAGNNLWLSLPELCPVYILFDQAIKTVLYLDFSAALNVLADIVPFATKLRPHLQDLELFLHGPLVASHIRIDDIDPALTALTWLPRAPRANSLVELLSDASPLLWLAQITCDTLRCNLFSDPFKNLRFAGRPSRLFALNVLNEQPTLLALERRAARDQVCDGLPICV